MADRTIPRRLSQQRMQLTSFALEGRPKSSESFGTTRRKFLEAPLPQPEGDADTFTPSKVSINPKKAGGGGGGGGP